MENQIHYRTLDVADINLYRTMRLYCLAHFQQNFGTRYEDEVQARTLKFDPILRDVNSQSFVYGAFLGSSLIGICGFTRETKTTAMHRGQISQFCIREEFERKRIGRNLLEATLIKAFRDTKLEIIDLGVMLHNQNAINLYEKMGLLKFGTFENYFKFEQQYAANVLMCVTRERFFSSLK